MTSESDIWSTDQAIHKGRVTQWKSQFDNSTTPALELEEYFSASWQRLWDQVWAEYDDLERLRAAEGFTRLAWQDGVEKSRRATEDFRRYKSKSASLTHDDWTQVPLALVLVRHLGEKVNKNGNNIAVTLERWHKFRQAIKKDDRFLGTLSTPQRVSWTLLAQWWSAAYQDPSLLEAAIAPLEAANASKARLQNFFGEPYVDAAHFAEVRKSVYNASMYDLFHREFNPQSWDKYFKAINLTILQITRVNATKQAMAQRLGFTNYMKMKGLSVEDAGHYIGSLDKPCPWLKSVNKEMPFFLWDVRAKRTVVVDELDFEPEYCCISHTWGRWRKEDVWIDGVPWLVPKNERFDVESLPDHLQQIRPRISFVWIDLFCIPQDSSAKADEEINRQATIFQNATRCIAWINDVVGWERTMRALDWLAVSYLHATTHPGTYETETLMDSVRNEANTASEFLTGEFELADDEIFSLDRHRPRPIVATNPRRLAEPACWFSSLWTLQEAMLCTDMTFVDRHWAYLHDRSGTPITLDTFFNLVETMENLWYDGSPYEMWTKGPIIEYSKDIIPPNAGKQYLDWPDGPRQLCELCVTTRMDNLLDSPSPTGLLMVANVRQCTSDRAPAIMSALGITEWYESSQSKKSNQSLVLNCYPLAFVKEAATKLGAQFYESARSNRKVRSRFNIFNQPPRGSMMPFSAKSGWFSHVVGIPHHSRYSLKDHPAVSSWNITQDGSVDIHSAGTIASTEDIPSAACLEKPVRSVHDMRGGRTNLHNVHFTDCVKDLSKSDCMFAISLSTDLLAQHGLILQGKRKTKFSSIQRLVKIGAFIIVDTEFPPSTEVNWMVL